MTNRKMIRGSEHAFTFKALADALSLRNHIIERFDRSRDRAEAEAVAGRLEQATARNGADRELTTKGSV
jgi:NADH dehydrogenase FAD-containing subunit